MISYWEAKPRILERNILLPRSTTDLHNCCWRPKYSQLTEGSMCIPRVSPTIFPRLWEMAFPFFSFSFLFLALYLMIDPHPLVSLRMTKSVLKMTLRARWLRLFTDDSDQTMCGMERVHEKPAFYHIKRLQFSQVSPTQQIIFLGRNML